MGREMWPNIVAISIFVPYDTSQSFSLSSLSLTPSLATPILSLFATQCLTFVIAIFMGEHMVNTNIRI